MTQRFRTMAPILPDWSVGEFLDLLPTRGKSVQPSGETDEGLDMLLKHAFNSPGNEGNGNKVLQQLTKKIRGPFGAPALEGPTGASLEDELLRSGGRKQCVPFALSEHEVVGEGLCDLGRDNLWEMLRCAASGVTSRGYAWLLN